MSSFSLLSRLLILFLLPLLSSARPCKTLFISYYTITTTTSAAVDEPHLPPASYRPTSRFFAVYRIVPLFPRQNHRSVHLDQPQPRPIPAHLGITSSSLQDRAKDILIVVAGLLFGIGCGAITASTMYLVWSMLTDRHEICGDGSDDESEDETSPKKMGYVKVAADPVVNTTATATKEGYEGK